jgi:hypothetical protein
MFRSVAAVVCSIATLAWGAIPSAIAAEGYFTPNETLVTRQTDLIDSEYSQSRAAITWVDRNGNLWLAAVDRNTGMFHPANGKGVLIDPEAMGTSDLVLIGNGPEWISMVNRDQIVYTKFLPGQPHSKQNARLAIAMQDSNGFWSAHVLSPELKRNAPYASSNPGDTQATISYADPFGNHYWRDVNNAASETLVSAYPASERSMRFVRGARALVFSAPVDGLLQVFRYWLDTQLTEQLTFDDGNKDLSSVPWMWAADEYGGDLILETIVDRTELRIYRLMDPTPNTRGQTPWSVVYRASSPEHGQLSSPEPFSYKGKSYVFFTATVPPESYQSQVFFTNIEQSEPLVRMVTPDTGDATARMDPEIFVSNRGPLLYFNRYNTLLGAPGQAGTSEGVYFARIGL